MVDRRTGLLVLAISGVALGALYLFFRPDPAHGDSKSTIANNMTQAMDVRATMPGAGRLTSSPSMGSATFVQMPAASAPDVAPPDHVFELVIADLKPGVGAPVLRAKEGDPIKLGITSRRSGTLEVHGYNQHVAVVPGTVATLVFKADHAGRFPIHLHDRAGEHLEVTALEILPR